MPGFEYRPEGRRGGFEILRLAGIPFFIDLGFIIFMGLVFLFATGSMRMPATQAGLLAFVFFFSLLGHEGGHALAARLAGCRHVSVTLIMFGGVTNHEPTTTGRSLGITLAGPAVSLVLALGGLAAVWFVPLVQDSPPARDFCRFLGVVNLIWLIFNMLPIYPMDGGQAIFHTLRFFMREHRAMFLISVISLVACVVAAAAIYLLGIRGIMIYFFLIMFFMQNLAAYKQFKGAR